MAASKGVWLDSKTGKVVESEPAEGVQLIAPGVEATPDEDARVKVYRDAQPKPAAKPVSTK